MVKYYEHYPINTTKQNFHFTGELQMNTRKKKRENDDKDMKVKKKQSD